MKKKFSLWTLLSLAFVTTLILSISVSYLLVIKNAAKRVKNNEEKLLLATGKQLANDPLVLSHLKKNETSLELQNHTNQLAKNYQLDFIVVMDMDAIRLTHPDKSKIGKHFKGGDETISLKGEKHISINEGTLGQSLRVFVPVFSEDKQLGVIALGVKMTSLTTMIQQSQKDYQISLIVSLVLSLIVAFCLSLYLKRILLNLEPREIASLLEERNAMLEETKDAVIVIDLNKQVLLANAQAQTLYQYTTEQTNLIGKSIQELLYYFEQIDLDKKVEQLYQQHGQDYLFSAAPIVVREQKTGYVIFLRNATEALFVTDQLANTTAYASALQSQSHEFMNKLHVIFGLVDLEAYEELGVYLEELLTPEQEFSRYVALLVKDPMMASFLIGERQKFSEIKTHLQIEIFPEIPLNNSDERTQLITIYRYIHYAFLQRKLPDDLQLSLEWQDDVLTSTYSFKEQLFSSEDWEKIQETLQSFYFKQLIQDCHSELHFTDQTLMFSVDYSKEE